MEEERSQEEVENEVPDFYHVCAHCGNRHTKFLQNITYECYDCGKTYTPRQCRCTIGTIMTYIEKNNILINIKQGASALEEMVNTDGILAFTETNSGLSLDDEGVDGYWVELSLYNDCTSWAYRKNLIDAIKDAFDGMIVYGMDEGYIDATNRNYVWWNFPPFITPPKGKSMKKDWIGHTTFDPNTNRIDYK